MFNKYFSKIYNAISERKWFVAGLSGIIISCAVIGLRFVSFDNNIESMLPGNDEIRSSMRFLRESNLSNKVILSLKLTSPNHTIHDLTNAVDKLAVSLKSPMVTDVISNIPETDIIKEMLLFLKYVPQLLDEHDLSRIEQQITPEGVKASLRRNYRQFLTPAGSFMMPFIQSDPLGIKSGVIRSLQKLSSSMGYEVAIENGHFVSRDGKHAMLILETPIILTDGFGSKKLAAYLQKKIKALPDFVSADIIAGHLHTISNEDVIKRDIRITAMIASIAFLLLFLFVFQDIRAALVFIIPMAAVLVAINLSYLFLNQLSYFIIGMGAVVAGIAVDYGIHVYLAVQVGGRSLDAVKHVARPVTIGALTTTSIFAAFFFSGVQGYHQLALFSILSIMLCLTCALFILPHFLSGTNQLSGLLGKILQWDPAGSPAQDKIQAACWGIFMIISAAFSMQVTFNSDISRFDGTEAAIIQAEQEFHHVWGGQEKPAVFVVSGKTLEEALYRNERFYQEAVSAVGQENFLSIAEIWPSQQTRKANAMQWKKFWEQGTDAKLKHLLQKYGPDYYFAKDAFSPFFENLYTVTTGEDEAGKSSLLYKLKERFVIKKQDSYQVLSFFPDKDQYITAMTTVLDHCPGAFIVSRNALSSALSAAVSSEIIFLSGIAALLIPLLTCLLLKNLRLSALAMVPVVTAILAILGIMPALGIFINAPSVIAAMVVVGLCIDYGIFMVYTLRNNLKTGTRIAVSLSAITTLIGAGVLLFARHPVLFSVGTTMVTGVLSGYVTSILVIPSLYRLFFENKKESLQL